MTNESEQIRMGELGGSLVNELIGRGIAPYRMLYQVGGGWIIRVRRGLVRGGLVVRYSPEDDRILVTATNWWGRTRAESSVEPASSRPDVFADAMRSVEAVL